MVPHNVRDRMYYVIPMPVDVDGRGPVELDYGVTMTYEVWDQLLNSYSSHRFLPDAIQECEERNEKHYG